MPSSCPKCRQSARRRRDLLRAGALFVALQELLQADSGFAIPYGKCFLCGGDLEVVPDRELGDSMRFRAIRDAVQFELNSFHFYKLARDRASSPEQRAGAGAAVTRPNSTICTSSRRSTTRTWTARWSSFRRTKTRCWRTGCSAEFNVGEAAGVAGLYRAALEMEVRTRDHFRKLARELPAGLEQDLCAELAAEEEEHVAHARGRAGAARLTVSWRGGGPASGETRPDSLR